jgi:hypothetical protein
MMNNAERGIRELARLQRESREKAIESYRESSKELLIKNISTKFTTSTIGPLSILEQHFGSLWGRGKPRHLLTDEERRWEAVKERFRTEVLNLGNSQKRAAVAEIHEYDVAWNRHHITLITNESGYEGRTNDAERTV